MNKGSNFLQQRHRKHLTVCFVPDKHDFCRNEQHHFCPLPLRSGFDNLGTIENRLTEGKRREPTTSAF